MYQKLKSFLLNDTLFTVTVILLVGIISFGLGRISIQGTSDISSESVNTVPFKQIESLNREATTQVENDRAVVVSRAGTKYHLLDCPGAQQMKEENRIEFDSIDEARAAGYEPAGNCAGI